MTAQKIYSTSDPENDYCEFKFYKNHEGLYYFEIIHRDFEGYPAWVVLDKKDVEDMIMELQIMLNE